MKLPLIIEPSQLAALLNVTPALHAPAPSELLILDLSAADTYRQGHIPGAVHMEPSGLLCGRAPIPNKQPDAEQLSTLLASLGITPTTAVVVYDDQMGPWAGRMIWTLHSIGHQCCAFLNGQLAAWQAAGLPLETNSNTATTVARYPVQINTQYLADIPYILAHLSDDDHCILDVRSPAEFSGEKIINARKGGHIPGARNYEWTRAFVSASDCRLRPATELLTELTALGITPDKTLITHCQTHRRSGLSYVLAKHLGFANVRCYDGSWFEWGNHPTTPVECASDTPD